MKRNQKRPDNFNWSRLPSSEHIKGVYLANPNAYTSFGKAITREELVFSLANYNRIVDLEQKKLFFKNLFFFTLASIPFIFLIHNIFFIGVK